MARISMDGRQIAAYALLAAYIVALALMFKRMQERDEMLSTIDRRTKDISRTVRGGVEP